jgi:putative transposase
MAGWWGRNGCLGRRLGMARHLRLEYEGAIYHIMARGNERSDIFRDDGDKKKFVEKLEELVAVHHVRMYA